MWRILTFGVSLLLDNIPQNQHMMLCSSEPFIFSLAKESGKAGHLANANCFCGWLLITNVGQLIGWQKKDCHILTNAPFVTKRKRLLITWFYPVYLHDKSGMAFCREFIYKFLLPRWRTLPLRIGGKE
jgi:hypothetical protein